MELPKNTISRNGTKEKNKSLTFVLLLAFCQFLLNHLRIYTYIYMISFQITVHRKNFMMKLLSIWFFALIAVVYAGEYCFFIFKFYFDELSFKLLLI